MILPVAPETVAAFLATALALVLSPGPDTMLIIRYAVGSGRAVGLSTVAGVQLGLLAHTALAVGGLSVLIAATPGLLPAIAICGAGYLAWLAVQALRAPVARAGSLDNAAAPVSAAKACRDAMMTNLLNPKVIMLFLALMPQFVDTDRTSPPGVQLGFLAVILIGVNTIWQALITLAAARARLWLARPDIRRIINVSTGLVLFAFAVLMLLEHAR